MQPVLSSVERGTYRFRFFHIYMLMIGLFLSSSLIASNSFLKVNDAFVFEGVEQVDNTSYRASWRIEPGYYLYQSKINVSINKATNLPISFISKAKIKADPYFGDVSVFYEKAKLTFELDKNVFSSSDGISISYQGCADAGLCYPPQTIVLPFSKVQNKRVEEIVNSKVSTQTDLTKINSSKPALQSSVNNPATELLDKASFLLILLGFFALGLGLSFTPCVLPMMPILAGIITRQGKGLTTKQGGLMAFSYVMGMSLSYSLAGVLVGLFGAEFNLQTKLQSPWVLIPMAGIFFLLALSMFGAFDIKLPSFISQKLNAKQDKISNEQAPLTLIRYFNVALMGAIAALVVSPCVTAPLAGVLLYISSTGDALLGAISLFVLSLGMGVPLILLGLGGGRLLPKSGVWMLEVKTFFALMLSAMGIYLLARILPENIILILITILVLFYSIHLINFIRDKPNSGLKNLFISLIILSLIYVFSLFISVLAGQVTPLKPLSFLVTKQISMNEQRDQKHESIFTRFESVEAMNQAILANEHVPYMIDLYADWCASCQELEEKVFANEQILNFKSKVKFYQLDITKNLNEHTQFMQANNLFGPPSMLFYNGSQTEVERFQGEPSVEDVKQFLENTLLSEKEKI